MKKLSLNLFFLSLIILVIGVLSLNIYIIGAAEIIAIIAMFISVVKSLLY